MNKSILITGGTGFFGKTILDYIKRHSLEYDITVLSRHAQKFIEDNQKILPLNTSYIQGDIKTFDVSQHFDYIIHAATPVSVQVNDDEMSSVILDGTENILRVANKIECKRLVFISSGAVYGPYSRAVSETDMCNPVTIYGKGKFESEKIFLYSGLDCVIARYFALAGKFLNKDIHFAIGNFVRNALNGEDIVINSDGQSIRSYLNQDDLCRMLFMLLEKSNPKKIYNIGSPYPISIEDLAYKVRDIVNPNINVKILGKPEIDSSRKFYVPNMSKFEEDFGPYEYIPLEDSIMQMTENV